MSTSFHWKSVKWRPRRTWGNIFVSSLLWNCLIGWIARAGSCGRDTSPFSVSVFPFFYLFGQIHDLWKNEKKKTCWIRWNSFYSNTSIWYQYILEIFACEDLFFHKKSVLWMLIPFFFYQNFILWNYIQRHV